MNDQQHLTEETVQMFVDGTLPDPQRLTITRHLEECPRCARVVFHQTRLDAALRMAIPVTAPERVRQAILREVRLAKRFAATTRLAGFLSTAFAGAATLGALAGIAWLSGAWDTPIPSGPLDALTTTTTEWLRNAGRAAMPVLRSVTEPFLPAQGLVSGIAMVCLALLAVGGIDRLLSRRLDGR
jgi:hypothetical protein